MITQRRVGLMIIDQDNKLSKYEFKLSKYDFKLSKYEFKLSKYEFKLSVIIFTGQNYCPPPSPSVRHCVAQCTSGPLYNYSRILELIIAAEVL